MSWSRLLHAYGRAVDTPEHLAALTSGSAGLRDAALQHLWSAILHQGTAWPATGPVVRELVAVLDRVDPETEASLVGFLAEIAATAANAPPRAELEAAAAHDLEVWLDGDDDELLYEDEGAANAVWARGLLGCLEVVGPLTDALAARLSHPDPAVRVEAACGVAALAAVDAERAEQVRERLAALVVDAPTDQERAAHLLTWGALGGDTSPFLSHPEVGVRMCAALAPGLAEDPRATEVLLELLAHQVVAVDRWFVERPPQLPTHPRFTVVARLLERVDRFEPLVDGALAVLGVASAYTVDADWGPLLAAAFRGGPGWTPARRRYLEALVDRPELWDPRSGNAKRWFLAAGLPHDRERCIALLGAA